MRKMMLALGCAAMVAPSLMVTVTPADAQRRYKYREWRDDRGRLRCRKPNGTTGLIIGGLGGGVLGSLIDNGNSSLLGTLIGAGGGALLGRSIDRGNVTCR